MLNTSESPWQAKTRPSRKRHEPITEIRDLHGRLIAELPSSTEIRPAEWRANRDCVLNAPRLLTALIEYTYNAQAKGIPVQPALLELIEQSGGPDLKGKVPVIDQSNGTDTQEDQQ